jgi:signal transduction histidine kinase
LDVTQRKEVQAGLERLVTERTAKLQELVGELEHFSYTITHDMRAPLRALQGFASMMMETCAECQEQEPKAFLRRIGTSAARMDALIVDALNFSKAVRQELPLEPVDPGALLRGMLDSYPEFQPSRAQIEIQGEIPLVMGNEAGLTQCFSNLLGNAVKFVRPGQKPQIRIRAEVLNSQPSTLDAQPQPWVRVWVEDDGIGIPGTMLSRVFDMFSRGHQSYEGTGIGLALVRKVMARMGGKVGVESEDGRGSRFWLDLRPGDLRVGNERES